jgi:hypothetical protein
MAVAAATIDFSLNQPTIPNVGANFGGAGPYANYVLLETVGINSSCVNVEIQNQSLSQIVLVLDDGRAASGAAPTGASVKVLAAAAAAGGMGGEWDSQSNKRRIQIYGPSGQSPQVSVFRDFN